MMRFRKRWLAKINIAFTNRITSLFAGWFPSFGILRHVGRKSGKVYRTPVNVFRAPNGVIIALTYSSQSEWVKNVLAAGGCDLKTRGKKYQLFSPSVVRDPTRQRFPIPVRLVLTGAITGGLGWLFFQRYKRFTEYGVTRAVLAALVIKNISAHRDSSGNIPEPPAE